MQTKGTNGALRYIVGSVGGSHIVRYRVIVVGVAVAWIPTTVGIFCPCTYSASRVGISTKFVYELEFLLHKFVNLSLLLVNLCLLFSDNLQ